MSAGLVPSVPRLLLVVGSLIGLAASATPAYSQTITVNGQGRRVLSVPGPVYDYEVKAFGNVTVPNGVTWYIDVKIERIVPGGTNIQIGHVKNRISGGNSQPWDDGYKTARVQSSPPPGGEDYLITVTGKYLQNGVHTAFAQATYTLHLDP